MMGIKSSWLILHFLTAVTFAHEYEDSSEALKELSILPLISPLAWPLDNLCALGRPKERR